MDGAGGPLAASQTQLGQAMRKLRQNRRWSLRSMEARQREAGDFFASRSQLSKYESGKMLPSLAVAEKLDRLYAGRSWIRLSVIALSQTTWSPWDSDWPADVHHHSWPEEYQGSVWVRLKPTPQDKGKDHEIRLAWGPWRWEGKIPCPEEGLYLVTGKSDDEVPIMVNTAPRSYCQFGLHEIAGPGVVMNINFQWKRVDDEDYGPDLG